MVFDSSGARDLWRLVTLFLFLSHLNGCLFWFISVVELRQSLHRGYAAWGIGGSQDFLPPLHYISYLDEGYTLLQQLQARNASEELQDELVQHNFISSYLFAFVWGMLNVSGVNFSKPADTLQAICSLLVVCCAILTNAVIIGSVSTTLYRLNYAKHTEAQRREAIAKHLQRNGVPKHLQRRVQQFYDFMGGVGEATPQDQLLPELPAGLAFQLELLQKREVFTKVPFFADCTKEQIIDLVPRVQRMFAMPGRTLVREGRISAGLYMIARGRIRIVRMGQQLNERIVGEFIGERSLINATPAEATCITSEFCELFLLRRDDFLDLTRRYPELLGRITFFAYRKDKASHQTATTKNRKLHEAELKRDRPHRAHNHHGSLMQVHGSFRDRDPHSMRGSESMVMHALHETGATLAHALEFAKRLAPHAPHAHPHGAPAAAVGGRPDHEKPSRPRIASCLPRSMLSPVQI